MTRPSVIRLVAAREISERIGSRLLRITTAILTVLVVAAVIVPSLVRGHAEAARVGLVGAPAQALAPDLTATARAARARLELSNVADSATARALLAQDRIDVAVSLQPGGARLQVHKSLSSSTQALVSLAIQVHHEQRVLVAAGAPVSAIRAALTPIAVATRALSPPPSHQTARSLAAVAAWLLLYLALGVYGGAVAAGVAQEKTSRTAEVLLACLDPQELLLGKVLGIGLCGLGQLAVPVAAGLIANLVVHGASIPSTVWVLMPATLLWFALGFTLFAFGFAAAGALVARQEEVQIVTGPLAFPLVIGYLLVYAVIASPHATWLQVLSFLPPLAPSMMPARIATGAVAWWEVVLAALLTLAAIYGVARLAAGIYRGALMRGGARLTWRQAMRLPARGGAVART